MSAYSLSPFVRGLLDDLRNEGFTPTAWASFLARAWEQSGTTAKAHPALTRSWARGALILTAAQVGALATEGLISDSVAVRRSAPGALGWMAWAIFDCWAHLGMAQTTPGRPLMRRLGLGTGLTLTRRAIAGLLIGRLLSGRPAGRRFALTAALAAMVTDTIDGLIARRRNEVSRLGAYLDGMADLEISTSLILTLAAQRRWPVWLTAMALMRWFTPFAAAASSYFGCSQGVAFGSTSIGRIAGAAQFVSICVALAPEGVLRRITSIQTTAYMLTAALLGAAPLSQFMRLAHD
jgi:CDP-diacylglycerol--glycerol-3-phosphate 3-phosphatidyltransferase